MAVRRLGPILSRVQIKIRSGSTLEEAMAASLGRSVRCSSI